MWPFKKNKVLDLTQGRIRVPESVRKRLENDYKDLTNSNQGANDSASALGFLGNMASASSSSGGVSSSSGEFSLQHLKVKMEDIEYKIESLRRRIDAVFDRVDLNEKKINRLEGR